MDLLNESNGYEPDRFTPADYATLGVSYATLVALHETDATHVEKHAKLTDYYRVQLNGMYDQMVAE